MWTTRSEELVGVRGLLFAVELDARPATTVEVLRGWQQDAGFRALFNALLAGAPFTAFRWETPAVTAATLERPFEFVVLDCPELARRSDPEVFAEHFARAEANVAVFPNLSGDAILVAPCPAGDELAYGRGETIATWGIRSYPTKVLIDPEGNLVGLTREEDLAAALEQDR